MLKLFCCLFCCFFGCLASVYARTRTIFDLLSFDDRGGGAEVNRVRYSFTLVKKVSGKSGIFVVQIDQSELKKLLDRKKILLKPFSRLPFDSWLHSYELAGDRIWKEYVTYVQPPAKKGRTPRNTEVSARDKRIVQQIKEASWKDNKFARASGENSIRMAERIYIDGIDLAELDIGNEVDFYGKALYRVGVFRFRGVEYSRFTLSKTEAEQELMKLNGVKP